MLMSNRLAVTNRIWQLLFLCGLALYASNDYAYGQSSCTVSPSAEWKDSIDFPYDSFAASEGGYGEGVANRWIKFAILPCDPNTVYFQNSRNHPFHYDFAQTHLDPFHGISADEFDQVTLYAENRQAVLGAVLWSRTFINRGQYRGDHATHRTQANQNDIYFVSRCFGTGLGIITWKRLRLAL